MRSNRSDGSFGRDAVVKRALLAESGVRALESAATCRRLTDSLLLMTGPQPPVLGVSCRRAGPPRHPVVLLAVAVGGIDEAAAAEAAAAPTFLIDVARRPDVLAEGGLQQVFQSPAVTKVFHCGCPDVGELAERFDIRWRGLADVGLAFEALLADDGGQPRRRVSLLRLHQLLLQQPPLQQAQPPPLLLEEDERGHAYWQRRPLTVEMALEAAAAARAVLAVHSARGGLGPLWAPLPDLAAYRRAAACPEAEWRRLRSPGQAALGAALRRRLAEARGGAAALAGDCQPMARKLPFGILK